MWKTILALFVIVVVLLGVRFSDQIGKGIDKVEAYYSGLFHQAVANKLYEGFKTTADKFNKRGPVMENKFVRFDKTVAGPGARITYFYTLVKHPSTELDRAKLQKNLSGKLLSAVCNNAKVKPSIELGAAYIYEYSGNDGIEVSRVEVNKHNCGFDESKADNS